MLPIDLQTLYTQLDKIGKTQVQSQLAAQTVQEGQIVANRRDTEHKLKSVDETDAGEENVGLIHDKDNENSGEESGSQGKKNNDGDDKSPAKNEKQIITDPALGVHIDISG